MKKLKVILTLLFMLFVASAVYPMELWLEVIADGPWTLVVGRLYQTEPDKVFSETGTKHIGPWVLDVYMGDIYALAEREMPVRSDNVMTLSIVVYTENGSHIISSSTYGEYVTIGYNFNEDLTEPRLPPDTQQPNGTDKKQPHDQKPIMVYN